MSLKSNVNPARANAIPIDIVITWVDGEDPVLKEKRNAYLKQTEKLPSVASKARRFSDNGEILYCLQSIATHMPWVNAVYIITDGQTPVCLQNDAKTIRHIKHKIRVVDHQEIFEGFEDLLPTFNSLAIETFMWRIKGLSEKFLYLNDDMFFCGCVTPEDFYQKNRVLLRGKWIGWNDIPKLSFHSENNRKGAAFSAFSGEKFFKATHVMHPLKRSIFEQAFEEHQAAFIKNGAYRFRSRQQFWPISVHNHLAFSQRQARRKRDGNDWVHFSVAFCRDAPAADIKKKLALLKRKDKKVACLNYSEAVVEKVPSALKTLENVTTPSLIQTIVERLAR